MNYLMIILNILFSTIQPASGSKLHPPLQSELCGFV